MGTGIIMGGGGGTMYQEDMTARPEDVRAGKLFGGTGSDAPQTGTQADRGAWNGAVGMNGSVAIPAGIHNGSGKVSGPVVTQRGGVNKALNCGESFTIQEGYHNGNGKVTANSLASQTGGATADDTKVLSPYTYWKDGVKRTGNLTVQSVVNFKAAQYSNMTLIASWALPSKGPWSGLRVMCKQGGYPSSVDDGTLFYEGASTYATKYLNTGTWYFRAWNYITTNAGRIYGGYVDSSASNSKIQGQQVFTSSGTFTVPEYVYDIEIFLVGAGGSGGYSYYYEHKGQGGVGGCGGCTTYGQINVIPGSAHSIVIGAPVPADSAKWDPITNTTDGLHRSGSTMFDEIVAEGGVGAYTWMHADKNPKWSGGSGGGALGEGGSCDAGNGGSDGSDGFSYASWTTVGIGQHRTTRAFEDPAGTLYAGGGAGGGLLDYDSTGTGCAGRGGAGGGGDGGFGSDTKTRIGHPGAPNTGGGGGGGGCINASSSNWAGGLGGTGICIVRWGYKSVI